MRYHSLYTKAKNIGYLKTKTKQSNQETEHSLFEQKEDSNYVMET